MAKRRKLAADNTFEKIETQEEISTREKEEQQAQEENSDDAASSLNNRKETSSAASSKVPMSRNKRRKMKRVESKSKREEFLQKLEAQQAKFNKTSTMSDANNGAVDANDESKFSFGAISSLLQSEDGKIKQRELLEKQKLEGQKKKRLTSKKRAKLLSSEVQQLQNVFEHPVFQSSPLSAIQQHLSNKVKVHQMNRTQPTSTTGSVAVATTIKNDSAATKTAKKSRVKVRKSTNASDAATKKSNNSESSNTKQMTGKRKRNE